MGRDGGSSFWDFSRGVSGWEGKELKIEGAPNVQKRNFFLNWEWKLFPFPHFFSLHPLTPNLGFIHLSQGMCRASKTPGKKGSAQGKINLTGLFYRHLYLSGKRFPFFLTLLIKQTKEIWEYPAGARQKSPRVFSGRVAGIALCKIGNICKGINSRETLTWNQKQEIGWNYNYKYINL